MTEHSFAICAYKESPYLEECMLSLINQTVKSNIIISTSTPNEHILAMGQKYDIPVFVNEGVKGNFGDWNFALKSADSKYVTLAHHDDVYEPDYAETALKYLRRSKRPIFFFSDYGELRNGEKITKNRLLQIKRVLLFPVWLAPGSVFARRLSLSLGDAISCPTVTYDRELILANPFNNEFRCNIDWERWEAMSKLKGDYLYCNRPLVYHRIYEESTTSASIGASIRSEEDYRMFCRFWPAPVARLLEHFYAASEKSNEV